MDWYLNQDWDEKSKVEFENKLKKSRGSYNKAQYLRIKGSSLIKAQEKWKQEAGVDLLKRVVSEYADEVFHSYFAYEQLGDYYRLIGDCKSSIANYEKVLEYYTKDRNGTSGIADIKYAEAMIEADKKEEYFNLIKLLTVTFKETEGSLDFKDEIFRYHLVLAKLYHEIGNYELAKEHGEKAFNAYQSKEVQFPKHPQLGLVKPSNTDLEFLKKVAR
jgi:tetratricopeptide (TPR) repeat protein